jgi:hypothetical protein
MYMILKDEAYLAAPGPSGQLPKIDAVNADVAVGGIVQPAE